MSLRELPSAATALASLRAHGDQFSTAPLAPKPLGELTYKHPTRGDRPVRYDPRVLAATGAIYCGSRRARDLLTVAGGRAWPLYRLTSQLDALSTATPIWGVSSYASTGQSCVYEAETLDQVYRVFREEAYRPPLVCDGAAGAGGLGINGVEAARAGIPVLGVTPYQGISSMAPRKHMLVYGDTYRDREFVVGSLGDALLVVSGGQGALRELLAAERAGCVMAVLHRSSAKRADSVAATWRRDKRLEKAYDDGRLILREKRESIADVIHRATVAAAKFSIPRRPERLAHLRGRFLTS